MKRLLLRLLVCLIVNLHLGVACAATDTPISINVKDTDAKIVMSAIATLAQINVLIDNSVSGTLTIKLDKVPFIEALELITKSKGLAYQLIGNTYIVATPDTLSKSYNKIHVIPVSNINAEDLKPVLSSIVKTFSVDPLTNSVIFSGNTQQEQSLRQTIAALDKKVKQISLEAKVISISQEDSKNLGVNWQWSAIPQQSENQNDDKDDNKSQESNLGGVIRFGANYEFRFGATLSALISNGRANILATPKMTTLPGKEAVIFIGDSIPVVTEKVENSSTTQTTDFVDAGIKLKYTAQITADNTVIAVVHTEVSTPTLVPELKNYKISTRQANTTVRLKDGETLVIGGLIGEEEIKNISKIPLLGDLPVLGNLFKNTSTRKSKNEVIIFLTPHIID